VEFKVFSNAATMTSAAAWWRCACPAAVRRRARGEIDGYQEFVKIYGAKGLAWIKVNDAAARAAKACKAPS
jgi:aspartyl-tRNA synthetase